MLENEFQYYLDNQEQLLKDYKGKYLVIKGQKIIGAFDSETEAFFETQKEHQVGTFLIQLCEEGNSAYSQIFHSRVAFP